ncbi:MAG: hypothetical protein Kow0062_26210 [Acidobacteriota bacterium]
MKTSPLTLTGVLIAAAALAAPSTSAQQRLGDPVAGSPTDPGNGAFYGQIQKNVPGQQGCSCGAKMEPAATFNAEFALDASEGRITLFDTSRPRDALVTMRNTGSGAIDIGLFDENSRNPQTIPLASGAARTVEVVDLVEVTGSCLDPTGAPCALALDVMHGREHNGISPFTDLWFPGPHVVGTVQLDPDSWTDCLWEYHDLWSSNTARDLFLDVVNTGNTDVRIEVEYSNNTFGYYNTNGSTPMNSPHRLIQVDDYQVVAIRATCDRIPTYECGPCNFEYKITFEP